MKMLHYTILNHGKIRAHGTILDLLDHMPYFLMCPMVPTLDVFNEVFSMGVFDAGMSGGVRWAPFKIGPDDHAQLSEELAKRGFERVCPPDWVTGFYEWEAWKLEVQMGVPSEEYLPLMRESQRFEQLIQQAYQDGQKDDAERLHLESLSVSNKQSALLMKYHQRRKKS